MRQRLSVFPHLLPSTIVQFIRLWSVWVSRQHRVVPCRIRSLRHPPVLNKRRSLLFDLFRILVSILAALPSRKLAPNRVDPMPNKNSHRRRGPRLSNWSLLLDKTKRTEAFLCFRRRNQPAMSFAVSWRVLVNRPRRTRRHRRRFSIRQPATTIVRRVLLVQATTTTIIARWHPLRTNTIIKLLCNEQRDGLRFFSTPMYDLVIRIYTSQSCFSIPILYKLSGATSLSMSTSLCVCVHRTSQ